MVRKSRGMVLNKTSVVELREQLNGVGTRKNVRDCLNAPENWFH
jgi:hypothetical protein